ncbi:MAG: hypothetical protein FWG34_01815 [Oscillospiraceae bacterium]|nr:hypothetical protein [Oscillospiraceae bacterium]
MKLVNGEKLLALFLAVAAILAFAAGCDAKSPESDNKSAETNAAAQDGEDDENQGPLIYVAEYLPEKDFGGYEFRIISPDAGIFVDYPEFWADAEAENGDVQNDALYKRNRIIEERYNIKFKQIGVTDWPELKPLFSKSVKAGSDDFDLCMLICREAWSSSLEGIVMPVSSLPYIDITQPWYAHDVNGQISINGKHYFAYSDECLNMFHQTMSVMFNKKLAADMELENMYNLAKDGKWTVDKLFEFSRTAAKDLNGDGKMTKDDRYGMTGRDDLFYGSFWVGSGIKTVGKDENDLLVFTGAAEKLYEVLDYAYQNIWGNGDVIYYASTDDVETGKMFENDQSLFHVMHIGAIPALRAMETDFGVLPFPKYSEAQDRYYSRVIDGWILCVPNTAQDLERASVIMEELAVESKNYTLPAYIDTVLRTKHTRDDESQEMLDLIHLTRALDIGDTFYYEPVRSTYHNVISAKKNGFAAAVEKNMGAIQKVLDKANEAALALEN